MQLKKIVNIMPDEKFLDYYITMSEKFIPGKSSYIVLTGKSGLKYIRSTSSDIAVIRYHELSSKKIHENLQEDSVVIFHSFDDLLFPLINSLPERAKKVWLFWGSDGYTALRRSTYLSFRSNQFMYPRSVIGVAKFTLSRIKSSLILNENLRVQNIIRKMDYCATWVDEDYVLAKKFNPSLRRLYFSYFTTELMKLDELQLQDRNLENILVGNSGAPTNNHVEALTYLKSINFEGKIYCPLSYGQSQLYIKNVCALGYKFFGGKFLPLLDFLPLNEYQEIINNCGIVWMNHKRQQAGGNLLTAFLTQKAVITDPKNPLNSTFDRWGLKYFKKEVLISPEHLLEVNLRDNRLVVLEKLAMENNSSFFNAIVNLD